MGMTVVITRNSRPASGASLPPACARSHQASTRSTHGSERARAGVERPRGLVQAEQRCHSHDLAELNLPGGQAVRDLGFPALDLCDDDGVF